MKKWTTAMLAILALMLAVCAFATAETETFSAEYEMVGTTSAGLPKNDTFVFEGKTEDGVIVELNFDIIRNKGLEGEYSKKSLMGYQMNVSDATVEEADGGFKLTNIGMNGYTDKYGQYMMTGTCDPLTEDSTFADLVVTNYTGEVLEMADKLDIYQYLASEADIELTAETPLSALLAIHGLYKDGAFVAGTSRVSFAGYHGGRSYGEQIDAIVAYILENKMTLDEVYEMFRTVNQQSQPIEERDVVSGATIAFVGDFQRMVYLAIHGELFEGVVTSSTADGKTTVEVATQGYAGEIETHGDLRRRHREDRVYLRVRRAGDPGARRAADRGRLGLPERAGRRSGRS